MEKGVVASWAALFHPGFGCSALGDEPRAYARGRLLRSRHLSCDPGLKAPLGGTSLSATGGEVGYRLTEL